MKPTKTTWILTLFVMLSCCQGAVKTGLDRVGAYKNVFEGRRLGIIANHTAYDRDGKFIVDVFRNMTGVTITALFSPEHGFWGTARAGEKINNQTDPVYNLPVYSLYGKTQKPTSDMLRNIDVLIFDIQDIGARFYTYIYTMSLAMEAAAQNGKTFVVLDRPNPINGLAVEGNILEPKFASFVGLYPIPVRHGMTVGELAIMFNRQGWLKGGVKADLVVVSMQNWRRGDWYDRTGLRFIKPSPNMTNLKTASVYPGLCLLEGTNVSEGRGTGNPFLLFGAPWIDADDLTARLNKLSLPGMRFQPISFTPNASKYAGERCHGVEITVTKRDLLESYWAGIVIVNEIHWMYPGHFEWRAGHFDRLCGTADVRNAIKNGSSLQSLKVTWQAKLKTFLQMRKRYLLYAK